MKVKINLLIIILAVITLSCSHQPRDGFSVEVNMTGTDDLMVYLSQYGSEGWAIHDSAMTENGLAKLEATNEMPEMYYLRLGNTRKYVEVFAGKGDQVNMLVDFNSPEESVINGSESHAIYDDYNAALQEIELLFQDLSTQMRQAMQSNDSTLMLQIRDEFDDLNQRRLDFIKNFCLQHPGTPVSPYIMYRNSYEYDYPDFEEVVAALDDDIKKSTYAESLTQRANTLKKVAVGQPFTDFTLNDPEGNPLPLSSVVGENYVLVDFWASWCQPCRQENPNIVAAYQAFHEKGFDVFGVSLDKVHNNWIEAIEKDGLTWNHVSDLKYWDSEAGRLYGVQSIPHSLLLSPEGIIIAKNLRQEELHEKLAELLN